MPVPHHLAALRKPSILGVCALFILSACGGGGGSGGSTTTTTRTPETVVFVADKQTAGTRELYAVQDDGSGLVKLSSTLLSGSVGMFKLSPDKTKVAYTAIEDSAGVADLYVVNVDGTNHVKVSQGLGPNADVGQGYGADAFWWSPDSTRLVYLADADIDEIQELYLVNADGSDHHKISGTVGSPAVVRIGEARWSPDSRYVAYYVRTLTRTGYIVDRFAINTHDTTIGGRNSVRVSGSAIMTTVSASVQEMAWSPDSTRIGYVSYEDSGSMREIYIANAGEDSGLSTGKRRVNIPLTSGQSCFFRLYWSGDSRYLLYYATPGLYTHDTQNSTARNGINISGTLAAGRSIDRFAWSPDFSRVAYTSTQDIAGQYELYSALPDVAASSVKLNAPLLTNARVNQFYWSPDSSRLAYVADQDTVGVTEAYTVAAAGGGAPVKVSLDNLTNSKVEAFSLSWSPDGQRIAYEVRNGDQTGLYVTTPDGNSLAHNVTGASFAVNSRFFYRPYINEYYTYSPWSTDNRYFIFAGSTDPATSPHLLYRADVTASQPLNITGSVVACGGVNSFDF